MSQATGGLDPTEPDPGLIFPVAPHAFLLFAAILSIFLARRDRKLWKAPAIFICGMALASLLGWGLVALLPAWTPTRPAFGGLLRVIFHASQGCRLAGPVLLYAFARWQIGFMGARQDMRDVAEQALGFLLGALSICVIGYPAIMRGDPTSSIDPLRLFYAIVDVVAVIESGRLALRWVRMFGWRDLLRWSAAPIWIVLMLIVGDGLLLVLGPYRLGLWGHVYHVQQAGLVPLWGCVCGVLATALLRSRPTP